MLPPGLLLEEIRNRLIPTLEFIEVLANELQVVKDPRRYLQPGSSRRLREEFALGPYGIHGVMRTLQLVYNFLLREDLLLDVSELRDLTFLQLEPLIMRIRALVLSFRQWVSRRLWLPAGGFRALQVAYEDAEDAGYLQVSIPSHSHFVMYLTMCVCDLYALRKPHGNSGATLDFKRSCGQTTCFRLLRMTYAQSLLPPLDTTTTPTRSIAMV